MKVLWISAYPVYLSWSQKSNNVREGWIQGALSGLYQLSQDKDLNIDVLNAFPVHSKNAERYEDEGVKYLGFYGKQSDLYTNKDTVKSLKSIFDEYKPDVIHIWGTERTYSNAAVIAAEELGMLDRVVIALQGIDYLLADKLTLEIPTRYTLGLSFPEIGTFSSLVKLKKIFNTKAEAEIAALRKVKHIIGRTNWDRIAAEQTNRYAKYYHCNETLRMPFYSCDKWCESQCEKHSIFVPQGLTCGKGLQQVLKAMPLILQRYPDAKIYSTGLIGQNNKYGLKVYNSFEKYLVKLIKQYKLEDKVVFCGSLSAEQMKERYLKSNVFVCASAMENESNALSEAKILGVPSVVSYVGGMLDRITHGVDGFVYPFNEPNVLANYICSIFSDTGLADKVSENAITEAKGTNNIEKNAEKLIEVYREIINEKLPER